MRRRDLLALLGGSMAWPSLAHAQGRPVAVIGFLNAGSAAGWTHLVAAFHTGLAETGYIEGQNVRIEYRWAEGKYERLSELAVDLMQRRVAIIVAGGGEPAALAAKKATTIIPIVFTSGSDPIKSGLIHSINRPEANVTGVTSFSLVSAAKRLSLLRELVGPATVAVISNPDEPAHVELTDLQAAAGLQNQRLVILEVRAETEIDSAFDAMGKVNAGGLIVQGGGFLSNHREKIVALASRRRIPTVYAQREFTEIGGLMSYGVDFRDVYRKLGIYTARILDGAKPGELPVLQPEKYELVINRKTAAALEIELPPALLALADEVIE